MKLYDRYINGEDGRSIYLEIYKLGQDAFSDEHFKDVEAVLTETFNRIAFNLDVIFAELNDINYNFKKDGDFNFEKPRLGPLQHINILLTQLDGAVKDFGYVPYALKLFYKIVGSCNFAWDFETIEKSYWQRADPIQIVSLNDLIDEISDDDWKEYMKEQAEEDEGYYLELSADYLHKDNISGGPAYSIQITKEPSIDGLLLNEPNNTTFINYLRICMENCGFSRITNTEYKNDYHAFFAKVQPKLKSI